MKTFLEVENKMGPVIPALISQFRPQLPETNPNIRKSDSTEKRKRTTPKKRFRPAAPKATMKYPPLLQTTPRPTNGASAARVTVREDTPRPGTGKMLGTLSVERNWIIPKDYLAIEDKKEDATIAKPPPVEESKMGEQISSQKEEKCGWGPDCPFCKVQDKEADLPNQQEDQQQKLLPKLQAKRPNTLSITKMRQQSEKEMESLNTKYNLDCFSNSELDSESDEDEWYQCEHGYEMLI